MQRLLHTFCTNRNNALTRVSAEQTNLRRFFGSRKLSNRGERSSFMRCTVKKRPGLSCAGRFCCESAIRYGVGIVSAIFSNRCCSNEGWTKERRKLVKYISIAIFYINVILSLQRDILIHENDKISASEKNLLARKMLSSKRRRKIVNFTFFNLPWNSRLSISSSCNK